MDKWDRLYAQATAPAEPARLLRENSHLLPREGRALDVACGLGGNALFLARHGLTVDAWDRSAVALRRLSRWAAEAELPIRTRQADLTCERPPAGRYQVVVVAHFLHRPLLPALAEALAPGGLLFYQTFSQAAPGWRRGPASPDLRLTPGELLRAFAQLQPLVYREEGAVGDVRRGQRELAFLVARRRL